MTTPEMTRLANHARELAAAFQIDLIETSALPPEQASADPIDRIVYTSPLIDETIYAVALHELGHILSPLGSLHDARRTATTRTSAHNLTVTEEEAAWAWAEHHALVWTPAMQAVREWATKTYTDHPPQEPRPAPPIRPSSVNSDAAAFGKSIKWSK